MSRATGMSPARGLVWLDRSGASVSSLCAIHCALTPLAVAILPAIGLGILADERTESILLTLAVTLGLASLGLGYRVHRSARVIGVVLGGFALLAVGRVAEEADRAVLGVVLTVGGGLTVAAAHLLSRRLCQRPCAVLRSEPSA